MAAERLPQIHENQAALPFSPELPKEELFGQSEILYRKSRKKILAFPEFKKKVRSSAKEEKIPLGSFKFEVDLEGNNYKYSVALDDDGKRKKLIVSKSFDVSFQGPEVTETMELIVSKEYPLISYTWRVSDDQEQTRHSKNNQEAIRNIHFFWMI